MNPSPSIFYQPFQSFFAGFESREIALGKDLHVLIEDVRHAFGPDPGGFLHIRPVENEAFFHGGDGIAVEFRSGEIGEQEDGAFGLRGHEFRHQFGDSLDFRSRAVGQVDQEDSMAFVVDSSYTIAHRCSLDPTLPHQFFTERAGSQQTLPR